MFNVEPQERWTVDEAAEFELFAAARLKETVKAAAKAGAAMLLMICAIVPFLTGHSLHAHWDKVGRYLLLLAWPVFLWLVYKVALIYGSWSSSREVRHEYGDPA